MKLASLGSACVRVYVCLSRFSLFYQLFLRKRFSRFDKEVVPFHVILACIQTFLPSFNSTEGYISALPRANVFRLPCPTRNTNIYSFGIPYRRYSLSFLVFELIRSSLANAVYTCRACARGYAHSRIQVDRCGFLHGRSVYLFNDRFYLNETYTLRANFSIPNVFQRIEKFRDYWLLWNETEVLPDKDDIDRPLERIERDRSLALTQPVSTTTIREIAIHFHDRSYLANLEILINEIERTRDMRYSVCDTRHATRDTTHDTY